jgi:hypothetical protein
MKKILILILAFSNCLLIAQEQSPPVQTEAQPLPGSGLGEASDMISARAQAREWLESKGLAEGYDEEKDLYIVIAHSTIPDTSKVTDARVIAYEEAMLKAKKALAESIAAKISKDISSGNNVNKSIKENSALYKESLKKKGPTSLDDMSMAKKVQVLAHNEMDTYLKERGINNPKESNLEDAYSHLLQNKSFADAIAVAANSEIAGMRTLICFETMPKGKLGQIAVVASVSSTSKMMAATMFGKGYGVTNPDKKREPVREWIKGQADKLLYSHGVLQRYDEKGNMHVLAFGQASTYYNDEDLIDSLYEESAVAARGAMRTFVGEKMIANSRRDIQLDTKTYAAEGRNTTKEYEDLSAFQSSMKAHASDLQLNGSTIIFDRQITHPVTGNTVVVSVVDWNLGSAKAFNALGASFNELNASRGGKGYMELPEDEDDSASEKEEEEQRGSGQGQGVGSDD